MAELKPCPFCGSYDIAVETIEQTKEVYFQCNVCLIEQQLYKDFKSALEHWNRRADNGNL